MCISTALSLHRNIECFVPRVIGEVFVMPRMTTRRYGVTPPSRYCRFAAGRKPPRGAHFVERCEFGRVSPGYSPDDTIQNTDICHPHAMFHLREDVVSSVDVGLNGAARRWEDYPDAVHSPESTLLTMMSYSYHHAWLGRSRGSLIMG